MGRIEHWDLQRCLCVTAKLRQCKKSRQFKCGVACLVVFFKKRLISAIDCLHLHCCADLKCHLQALAEELAEDEHPTKLCIGFGKGGFMTRSNPSLCNHFYNHNSPGGSISSLMDGVTRSNKTREFEFRFEHPGCRYTRLDTPYRYREFIKFVVAGMASLQVLSIYFRDGLNKTDESMILEELRHNKNIHGEEVFRHEPHTAGTSRRH